MLDLQSPGTGMASPARKSGLFYGYIIVLCSFLILLILFGTNYSFGVFFNPLLADTGWSRAVTSVGYSIAQLVGGVIGMLTGRISDSMGPRVMVLICGGFMALGCLLMSQVSEIWQLYIFYGLFVGIGFGGAAIPLTSTVSRWFIKRRGLMTGIVVAGIASGTIVMSLVSNWLIGRYTWQTSFIIIGVVALIVVIPAAIFLKRDPGKIGQRAYGENETPGSKSAAGDQGMPFKKAVRTGRFWIVCCIYIFFGFFVQSIMLHLVPHAKAIGISAGQAASIMSFLGMGSIVGRIVMGSISDRIGVKYTLITGLGIALIAFLWLLWADNLVSLYLFAVIYGFAYGALIAMQTLTPARMFGLVSLGTMVGVITFVYTLGGFTGPILTGRIFDMTGSYHTAFIICTALAGAGIVLALALKQPASTKK
jgi:MFS family permease